ncbi:MAG: SdrD B-like domain-containing protein, partial [Saprospiraceae bacterium]
MKNLCNSNAVTSVRPYVNFFLVKRVFLFLSLIMFSHLSNLSAQCSGSDIGGNVFLEKNINPTAGTTNTYGIKDSNESGYAGVTVNVWDVNGVMMQTTTDANGDWAISGMTYPVRVEYSWSESWLDSSPDGTNTNTSVQFHDAANCNADFGLFYSADFCQFNPDISTSIFVKGDKDLSHAGNDYGLISFPSQNPVDYTFADDVDLEDLGTVYGQAYKRETESVFLSAYMKRHSELGDDGPGAIYRVDKMTGNVILFADLNAIAGTDVAGADPRPTGFSDWFHDPDMFPLVGRSGIGDIEMSDDEKTLYAVNMKDKKLYILDATDPDATATSFKSPPVDIPNNCDNPIDSRPMALKYYQGDLYVGVTCSAESTVTPGMIGDRSQMKTEVWKFDPITNTFAATPEVSVPLDYDRGPVYSADISAEPAIASLPDFEIKWRPWQTNWKAIYNDTLPGNLGGASNGGAGYSGANFYLEYPQPLLSDIEFDNGNMILGIRDINGDMLGNEVGSPDVNEADTHVGTGMGDILRLCGDPVSGWTTESNGSCGGVTTMGDNNLQGPGGGEFYWNDQGPGGTNGSGSLAGHAETTSGALVQVPGQDEIISTGMGVEGSLVNGILYLNNTTGEATDKLKIVNNDPLYSFGKSQGLGDLEVLCDPAPIEIGNRVWIDKDKDGVQDPDDTGIAGITVELYDDTNTLVATAITDANGNYIFSNATGTTTGSHIYGITQLDPDMDYTVRIPNTIGGSQQTALAGHLITLSDTGEGSQPNVNDNDGITVGTGAEVMVPKDSILYHGNNNHTFDFGFVLCEVEVAATVSTPKCVGEEVLFTSTPTDGATPYTYVWTGPGSLDDANAQNPKIASGVIGDAGTYKVIVTDAVGCMDSIEVILVVNPLPTCTAGNNGPVCMGDNIELTETGNGTSWAWSGPDGFSSTMQNPTAFASTGAKAGTYTVIVTDANNCTSTCQTTVVVNPLPICDAGSDMIITCNNNMTVTLDGSGSSAGLSYLWTGPGTIINETSQNPTVNEVGTYTIEVTNPTTNCTSSCTVNVTNDLSTPTCDAGADMMLNCTTASVVLDGSGSTAAMDYLWTTADGNIVSNATTLAPTVNGAGTYTLTVTDPSNGCSSSCTVEVTQDTSIPTCDAGTTAELTCTTTTTQLDGSGSTAGLDYLWTTTGTGNITMGETTLTPTVDAPGVYTLTVTNTVTGCTSNCSVTITEDITPPSCTPSNDGPLTCVKTTVTVSSTTDAANATYAWSTSNGGTITGMTNMSTATATTAGTYSVLITNTDNGCTNTCETIVTEDKAIPSCDITETGELTCIVLSD